MDEIVAFIGTLMVLVLSLVWYIACLMGGIYLISWCWSNL